jgi:hypothetical protein
MIKVLQSVHPLMLLIIATTLEVIGDTVVRLAIYDHAGPARVGLFMVGATFLLGYGTFVNLSRVEFSRVVGLYIATLFVVWQLINFAVFRTPPALPMVAGGAMIIAGGALVTFWRP